MPPNPAMQFKFLSLVIREIPYSTTPLDCIQNSQLPDVQKQDD